MTTIAYKDGVIACDSRVSSHGTIQYDDFDKSKCVDGVKFFFSGSLCDTDSLIKCWFGGASVKELDAWALVFDGCSLWLATHTEKDGLCKTPLMLDRPYAIGSGSTHAFTAMDMGATAEEAVHLSAKRDTATGGTVKVHVLVC